MFEKGALASESRSIRPRSLRSMNVWFGGMLIEIARTTTGHLIRINQEAQAPISDTRRCLWVACLLSAARRFAP
jgi:hypothetical protein